MVGLEGQHVGAACDTSDGSRRPEAGPGATTSSGPPCTLSVSSLQSVFMGHFSGALRAALPVDLEPIAHELGVSVRTIRSWVRGERTTDPGQVFALERALGCEPGELSRHLGYVPVAADTVVVDRVARVRSRVASEAQPMYDDLTSPDRQPDLQRLLGMVDLDRAAVAGLRSELQRVVLDDLDREFGHPAEREREAARDAYEAAAAAAGRPR